MRGAIMPTLTIRDAALALGVSVDTVRRRLARGDLTGQQVSTGGRGGFTWYVNVPDDVAPGDTPTAVDVPGVPATALVVQVIAAERDALRTQVDDLRAERDRLLAIIEALAVRQPVTPSPAEPAPAVPTQPGAGDTTPEPSPSPAPVEVPTPGPVPAPVSDKVAQGQGSRVRRAWDVLRGR